jgi:hypothetical protein
MDTKINILIWEKLLISTQFCAPHSCENNIPQSKKHKVMLQIRKSNNITTFFSMLENLQVMNVTSNPSLEF